MTSAGARPEVPAPSGLSPTAQRVATALGLDEGYWPWLTLLDGGVEGQRDGQLEGSHVYRGSRRPPSKRAGHPLSPLPSPPFLSPVPASEAAGLLERLGCGPKAISDVVSTLPDPDRDPELWWLLERCHRQLVATMGDLDVDLGRLPDLPAALGVVGSCFPIHLFLAAVPAVRAWHAALGVPDDVSWATLSDLSRRVAIKERLSGQTGAAGSWFMMLHVRGVLFEIGALQYAPYHVGGPGGPSPWFDEKEAEGYGFFDGDLAFGVHIPTGAPLDRESCLGSMRRAGELFGRAFSSQGRRVATCSSWLLDDQLAVYLPAESNIVRFQQMFQLVPGWREADEQVLSFVFRNQGIPPDPAHASTRLQRSVLGHLAAGSHFRWRTGWCDLPPEDSGGSMGD